MGVLQTLGVGALPARATNLCVIESMKLSETLTLKLELPCPSETVPIWSVADVAICSLVVASDGYSAEVTASSTGSTTVDVRTNCDFGSGVREHHTTFDVAVDGADAAVPEVQQVEEPTSKYWKVS